MHTTYQLEETVAIITLDDGKVNAVSFDLLDTLKQYFDQAAQEARAVVLCGRTGCFCAGFDLQSMQNPADATRLVETGFSLCVDLLEYPLPVVMAATGHSMAMGAFLLLAADKRIGAGGTFKIGLNETRIGIVIPPFAMALARARLAPTWLTRSVLNAEILTPSQAVQAGFFDTITPPEAVMQDALTEARNLGELHPAAFQETKQLVYGDSVRTMRSLMEQDFTLMPS